MTDSASDLDILLPDKPLHIAGGEITVREYTFLEGLQVDGFAEPVLAGLRRLFLDRDAGSEVSLQDLAGVFAGHPEIVSRLLSISTGLPVSWVNALNDADGQLLLMTWWSVNRFFFVRRLAQEMGARQAAKSATAQSTGQSVSRA